MHETPGVTRDRKELVCEWNGVHFLLIDTGGVDDLATDVFSPEIAKQARAAIAEADLVLFVVDARHGITPGDEELAVTLRAVEEAGASCSRTRSTTRARTSRRPSSTGSGSAIRWPLSALHGHGTGDLLDEVVAKLAGRGTRAGRRGDDPRRDPRPPERRQVVAPERARRARAGDRLGRPGHDPRRDRHDPRARRTAVPARRHGGPAAQAQAAAGDRVLLGAARARGRRARRRRADPDRRERGDRRAGPLRRGRRAQGRLLDARRALEVGRERGHARGRQAAARVAPAPAPAGDRGLGEDRPRTRPPARPRRLALREARRPGPDARR